MLKKTAKLVRWSIPNSKQSHSWSKRLLIALVFVYICWIPNWLRSPRKNARTQTGVCLHRAWGRCTVRPGRHTHRYQRQPQPTHNHDRQLKHTYILIDFRANWPNSQNFCWGPSLSPLEFITVNFQHHELLLILILFSSLWKKLWIAEKTLLNVTMLLLSNPKAPNLEPLTGVLIPQLN